MLFAVKVELQIHLRWPTASACPGLRDVQDVRLWVRSLGNFKTNQQELVAPVIYHTIKWDNKCFFLTGWPRDSVKMHIKCMFSFASVHYTSPWSTHWSQCCFLNKGLSHVVQPGRWQLKENHTALAKTWKVLLPGRVTAEWSPGVPRNRFLWC